MHNLPEYSQPVWEELSKIQTDRTDTVDFPAVLFFPVVRFLIDSSNFKDVQASRVVRLLSFLRIKTFSIP